jgi:hypothetical protein
VTDPHTNATRERLAKFGRDVFVNGIANLVAAAIIYLTAVAAGYLEPPRRILIIAMLVLLAVSAFRGRPRPRSYKHIMTDRAAYPSDLSDARWP